MTRRTVYEWHGEWSGYSIRHGRYRHRCGWIVSGRSSWQGTISGRVVYIPYTEVSDTDDLRRVVTVDGQTVAMLMAKCLIPEDLNIGSECLYRYQVVAPGRRVR
jgi:hypothetical protein